MHRGLYVLYILTRVWVLHNSNAGCSILFSLFLDEKSKKKRKKQKMRPNEANTLKLAKCFIHRKHVFMYKTCFKIQKGAKL